MQEKIPSKRILWVNYSDLGRILDKATWLETSKHLNKRGYQISLLTPASKNVVLENVRVISFPAGKSPLITNAAYAIFLLIYLTFYIAFSKYDFIIVHAGVTAFSAMPVSVLPRPFKPNIVLDCRSPPILTFGVSGYVKKLAYKISFLVAKKIFNGITTVTPMMKKDICRDLNLEPGRVGVWSNGASTTIFNPRKFVSEGRLIRAEFGLADKFVVFYHGSLSITDRGIVQCIEAIKILKGKHEDIILFLLGDGETSKLRDEIRKRNIQDNVIIHGPVDYEKVPRFIAMCDVAIVPLPNLSKWRHQCPLKLLEYLAMKKVVIATDIPANRYIIGNRKCGIFISAANSEEIAKAILYASEKRTELSHWGLQGRTIIKARYSYEKVAEEIDKYLSGLQ